MPCPSISHSSPPLVGKASIGVPSDRRDEPHVEAEAGREPLVVLTFHGGLIKTAERAFLSSLARERAACVESRGGEEGGHPVRRCMAWRERPHSRSGPLPLDGRRGDLQHLGDFLHEPTCPRSSAVRAMRAGRASRVARPPVPRAARTNVDGRGNRSRAGARTRLNVTRYGTAASLGSRVRAGVVHEDPTHGLGGDGEETPSVGPAHVVLVHQSQIRLVHERLGVERTSTTFPAHVRPCQAAQFVLTAGTSASSAPTSPALQRCRSTVTADDGLPRGTHHRVRPWSSREEGTTYAGLARSVADRVRPRAGVPRERMRAYAPHRVATFGG